jgi:transposase
MGHAIEVTRLELSATELRQRASRCGDGRVACRVLAIAHVLEGASRAAAASACGMDRQTLRDWVHRYNGDGIAGLSDAPRSGRPPALSQAQMEELKELVLAGPDLAHDGVVRWRCIDLCSVIKERFAVEVHERTVGKLLRRMGLTRLQPRPYHPKKDAAAQEAFKKTLPLA